MFFEDISSCQHSKNSQDDKLHHVTSYRMRNLLRDNQVPASSTWFLVTPSPSDDQNTGLLTNLSKSCSATSSARNLLVPRRLFTTLDIPKVMMTSYFHNLFSVLGEPDSDITCKELSSGNGMNLMETLYCCSRMVCKRRIDKECRIWSNFYTKLMDF